MEKILILVVGLLIIPLYPSLLPAQNLELDYSTYLGGTSPDLGYSIAIDSESQAYVSGVTYSFDFPTQAPYQLAHAGSLYTSDAFVAKLTSSGSSLLYSTYLGGSDADESLGLSIDSENRTYILGRTESLDFPTVNPYQPVCGGGQDIFLSQLSSSGSDLIFSTYLGGGEKDSGYGIYLAPGNEAQVTGSTTSSLDFPIVNPYQAHYGGGTYDSFVCRFSSTGSTLIYSTYLGGGEGDCGKGIWVDSANRVYIAGLTCSPDFPTENPYQSSFGGGYDAFVSCLSSSGSVLTYSTYLGGSGTDKGWGVAVDSEDRAYVTGRTGSADFPTRNPYQSNWAGSTDVFVSKFSSSGSRLIYSTYLGGSGEDYGYDIYLDSDNRAYITGNTDSSDFPTKNSYQSIQPGNWDVFVSRLSSSGFELNFSSYLGGKGDDYGHRIRLDSANFIYVTGWTGSGDFPTDNSYQSDYKGGLFDAFVSRLNFSATTPTPPPTPSPTLTPEGYKTPLPTATPSPTPTNGGTPMPTGTQGTPLTPTPTPTPSSQGPSWIYDYNGDGTSDIAVFRESSGLWAVRGITRVYFGGTTDETVPGDYNGDGTTEIGIFRPSSGLWALRGVSRAYFGGGSDLAEPGDYDGDGTADIGIFRAASGLWAIRGITRVYFGGATDEPIPGYYDADGSRDIGIFRPSSGLWAIRGVTRVYFGGSTDEPVPGDYTGDAIWEAGIYRDSSGLWAIRGVTRSYFGSSSDQPLPADYSGNRQDDVGIFRDSSGLWVVSGVTRVYFGSLGDIPVTR